MKVISFCLFGKNKKYTQGLLENIDIIKEKLPGYHIFVIIGSTINDEIDIDKDCLDKLLTNSIVTVIKKDYTGYSLMIERVLLINEKNIDIVFSRDADSRISERDIWCIRQFEDWKTHKKMVHIVRDHKNHDQYIMGGMCGFCKINGKFPINLTELYKQFKQNFTGELNQYGIDQYFLQSVYKMNLPKLIHSSNIVYGNEKVIQIPIERVDKYDFIGNAIDFDYNGNPFYLYEI
jgi:hypothetical protein